MQLAKYSRLLLAFLKTSFIADLEYRANFVIRVVTDIFWYVAQITTFEALYLHTKRIGDWQVEQTRIFLGILFVSDALYMILFHDNLERMSDRVRKGDLDLLLVKPMNSQFLLSMRNMATAMAGNLLIAIGWLTWSILNYPEPMGLRLLWLLLLIPCGLISLYSIRFMISATAVIFTTSDNLQYLWYQTYRLGMRPDSIYRPWLRVIILSVIPVAAIASIPTRALFEEPNLLLYSWVCFWSLGLVWISHKFWHFALKYYSSASS